MIDIHKKTSETMTAYLKDRYMDGESVKSFLIMTNGSRAEFHVDFQKLGFKLGKEQDHYALGYLLYGMMDGMKCTDKPEWLEWFLHEVGQFFEAGRGHKEHLKFLERMWSDEPPKEIEFEK